MTFWDNFFFSAGGGGGGGGGGVLFYMGTNDQRKLFKGEDHTKVKSI